MNQEQNQPMNQNQPAKQSPFAKPLVRSISGLILVALAFGAFLFFKSRIGTVSIDDAEISAPVIALGPETSDVLDEVYVREGDIVVANQPLAKVGSEIISSKTGGIIVSVLDQAGTIVNRGQAVVSIINPDTLRIKGEVEENKGLARIAQGQPVSFTVDAFGGTTFTGIVDSVAPMSSETGATWSISDKRPTKKFEVSVRYDVAAHPEFRNGMSAKMKIFVR